MRKFIATFFGEKIPKDRDGQNEWIKSKHSLWQRAWHDAFDQDDTLRALGEYDRPDTLPDDLMSDYRLIFGLSHAEKKTRQKCFSYFYKGAEMHQRFDDFLSGKPKEISEDEASALVTKLAPQIELAMPREDVDFTKLEILYRDNPDTEDRLMASDKVSILFEKNLLKPHQINELPAIAAELFLSEPLYVSAGNCFEPGDWICGAMITPERDAVYQTLYQLSEGGWFISLSGEGPLLVKDWT